MKNRLVSRKDLARACRLSVSTVSLALNRHPRINERTCQRVADVARRMGFRGNLAARRLIRRRYRNRGRPFDQIALVAFDRGDRMLQGPYLGFLRGVEHQVSLLGASMVFLRIGQPDDWGKMDQLMCAGTVDGFALFGVLNDAVAERLRKYRLPWVVLGEHRISTPVHEVDLDFHLAGELAVRRLARQGHRRIAFLAAGAPSYGYQRELRRGFRDTVRTLGLDADEALIRPREDERPANPPEALKDLLALRPTAVVFAEPGFGDAYGTLLRDPLLAPLRDMALVFCEMAPCDLTAPNVCVIHFSYEQVGMAGATLLKDLTAKSSFPTGRLLIQPLLLAPGQLPEVFSSHSKTPPNQPLNPP